MKPASVDERGKLYELCNEPFHINMITIKQGYARGGHSHKYQEMFMVVSGAVEFIEPKKSQYVLRGEVVMTHPDIPHIMYAPSGDSVLIEVRDGGIKFKANPYKPFREWVEYLRQTPRGKMPHCGECGRFHSTRDHVLATGGTGRNTTSWNKK